MTGPADAARPGAARAGAAGAAEAAAGGEPSGSPEGDEPRVVVRDRRRIDPQTGKVRIPEPDAAAASGPGAGPGVRTPHAGPGPGGANAVNQKEVGVDESAIGGVPTSGTASQVDGDAGSVAVTDDEVGALQAQLDERTADLQRISAEYANYRRRVDRDREAVSAGAKAQVAHELLTVLDDLERADAHGDLTGPFKAVGDRLVGTLANLGLAPFGAEGEEFDPSVHEAVQHTTSAEVGGPTVSAVLRRGYTFGERVLRPAMVAVTDRDPDAPAPAADPGGAGAWDPAAGPGGDEGPGAPETGETPGTTASPSAANPDAV